MNNFDVVAHLPRKQSKSGPKPRFAMDDLIREALSQGIDQFSLSRIAKALGVAAPALYRVVESREHLLYSSLDRISQTLPELSPTGSWQEMIENWADMLWDICEDYPGLDKVLMTSSVGFLFMRGLVKGTAEKLGVGRISEKNLVELLDSVADSILVSHLAVTGWREVDKTADEKLRERCLDALSEYGVHYGFNEPETVAETYRSVVSRKVKLLIRAVELH